MLEPFVTLHCLQIHSAASDGSQVVGVVCDGLPIGMKPNTLRYLPIRKFATQKRYYTKVLTTDPSMESRLLLGEEMSTSEVRSKRPKRRCIVSIGVARQIAIAQALYASRQCRHMTCSVASDDHVSVNQGGLQRACR